MSAGAAGIRWRSDVRRRCAGIAGAAGLAHGPAAPARVAGAPGRICGPRAQALYRARIARLRTTSRHVAFSNAKQAPNGVGVPVPSAPSARVTEVRVDGKGERIQPAPGGKAGAMAVRGRERGR